MHTRTLGLAALALSLFAIGIASAAERPNVIVLLVDDQGYGDLSCHGNPVVKTPNLDRLHAESIRLTDFHVSPMCTPTRGQLLTGRDALDNGAMNVSSGRTMLRQGIPTMADIFAAAGYRTGIFGKWHLGDNYPYRPHDRGFHEAVYFPSSHIPSAADYWNNDYFDDTYRHNDKLQQYSGYCTDVWFNEAMRWIEAERALGKPFFVYLPTNAPHGPLFVADKYREPYRNQPANVASYFGMIANVDENVGRLDAFLRTHGLRENTLLIYMTDNGTTVGLDVFNAGMRGRKIELYDGGHRVPCFVRWPAGDLRSPCDVGELACVQDILPSLIDLCGLERPVGSSLDGVSLAPLLRGEADRLDDRMLVVQFSRMNDPVPKHGDAAVLWRRWRMVNHAELYDLDADPAQARNVAADHADVLAKMQAHYDDWWAIVSPRVDLYSAIHVGSNRENPVMLSPCDWQDVFLDQAAQIRAGLRRNGPWNLLVERAGEYDIELRRWPREADAPIAAGLPAHQATDGVFAKGAALPVARARLAVGDIEQQRAVGATDKRVSFRVTLPRGRTQLLASFDDDQGREIVGAYYVYVTRP